MVQERSQVASRTNYRVLCENSLTKIDFFVYYLYKTDAIAIVGVNSTNIESTVVNNARLLAIVGNGRLSGVLAKLVDREVSTPGNSAAVSVINKGKENKNKPQKIALSNPSVFKGKRAALITLANCERILKRKNMV
jgi:hypothetical protein